MCAVISDIYQLCMHRALPGTQRPHQAFMQSRPCHSSARYVQRPLPQMPRSRPCPSHQRSTCCSTATVPQHDCKPLCSPSMFATSAHAAAKVSDLFPLACALLCFMQHQDIMAIACSIPACVALWHCTFDW
jgi:hypothetical protein